MTTIQIENADSNVTGGDLAAALQKKRNCGNREDSHAHHCNRSSQFVIAVWSTKAAHSGQNALLGDHRRQSQQSRLELGLRLSD